MRIKSQFILSIIVFSLLVIVIASALVVTEQQTSKLRSQEELSQDIETRASRLVYLSSDYFLYQKNDGVDLWLKECTSISEDLSKISAFNPEQQTMVNNIGMDVIRLNDSWTNVVLFLSNAPRNVSIRIDPVFQAEWSILSVQNQGLIYDAQQLTNAFRREINQVNSFINVLVVFLIIFFGAYFVANYLITYRNMLKSVTELQKGIQVIGRGNLDFRFKKVKKDELGSISLLINNMTSDLKAITASKSDLEIEIEERKKKEEELRRSEKRYRQLFDSLPEGFVTIEMVYEHNKAVDFRFLEVNPSYARLIGKQSIDEIVGKTARQVFGVLEDYWYLLYDGVIKTGEPVHYENYVKVLDEYYEVVAWKTQENKVAILCYNTTELRKSERALKKSEEEARQRAEELQKLMDIVPAAIWISVDPECKVIVGNQMANSLYEADHGENVSAGSARGMKQDIKRRFYQNGKELLPKELPMQKAATQNIEIQNSELEVRTPSGKSVIILGSAKPLVDNDGKVRGCLGAFIDITERKKVESDLRTRTEQLEQIQKKLEEKAVEVEEYANNMEALAEKRLNEIKDNENAVAMGQAATMMAHDIRNPLQAIKNALYVLKKKTLENKANLTANTPQLMELMIESIESSIEYADRIVLDLKDFTTNVKISLTPVDINKLIDHALLSIETPPGILVKKNYQTLPLLDANSCNLERVFRNLIGNAFQAMEKGGTLNVVTSSYGGLIEITFADTGKGISDMQKEQLFKPFHTTKAQGMGLGLAICKKFIEKHNGTITLESHVNKGSIFTIKLPLEDEQKGEP